jgi:hypothetical protein
MCASIAATALLPRRVERRAYVPLRSGGHHEGMELIPTVTADGRIIFRVVTLTPGERLRRFVRGLRGRR